MTKLVYLDYNATTPLLNVAKEAILDSLEAYANPSAVHQAGRAARAQMEKARSVIANALSTNVKNVTFTSGGTEGNHIALSGLNLSAKHIYASAVEHSSIHKNILPQNLVPVMVDGQVDIAALKALFQREASPKLMSIVLANSETGVVQQGLNEIVSICHENGCLVHTDAVQAFGKVPVSFDELGVDLMTVSAHKIGGPKGVGALLSKPNVMLKATLLGGGQEKGLRSGTENIPGIMGFAAAADYAMHVSWESTRSLMRVLVDALTNFNPNIRVNSTNDGLPNTLNVSTPGYVKDTQVIHFDLNNIAVSAGSACSSGKVTPSHVLTAMGVDAQYVQSAIRVSLSPSTTRVEIDAFINAWKKMQNIRKVEGL